MYETEVFALLCLRYRGCQENATAVAVRSLLIMALGAGLPLRGTLPIMSYGAATDLSPIANNPRLKIAKYGPVTAHSLPKAM
jgi:hypothetical protein